MNVAERMDNALKALTFRWSASSIEEEGCRYCNVIRDVTASLKAVSNPHTSAAIKELTAFYADCSLPTHDIEKLRL
jgi:hypothetical protein